MTTNPSTDLVTITPSGDVPSRRLGSALQAQTKFTLWRDAAKSRHTMAALINGLFDGNPPYRTDKRRHAGQEWRANFNTLEAGSRKDAAKAPYYDIFSSTEHYFEAQTTIDNPTGLDAASASRTISIEFDRMLKAWPGFDAQMWVMLDDFIKFNKGFLWWLRQDSWRFQVMPWHRVYFPEGYSTDTDEWEEFAIEHEFPVTSLWDLASRGHGGWNKDAVIKAIQQAVPSWREEDPIEVQKRLKESVYEPAAIAATVHAASVFTKEFSGSWSRMMVLVQRDGQASGQGTGQAKSRVEREQESNSAEFSPKMGHDDWLFNATKVAEDACQILAAFFFEVHDGSLNALEGLGKKLAPLMQVKDRIACSIADNVLLRSTILLQMRNASSSIKAGLLQIGGGVCVIPAGFEAQTSQIFGDLDGSLAVNADFDRRLDANTGIYRPQFEKPRGNPESATAASLRFGQATVLSGSAVNRFENQLDRLGQEVFRRAMKADLPDIKDPGVKAARKLQSRLKKLGVDRKQIEEVIEDRLVHAVRSIGNGSSVMRQQMLGSLSAIAPYMSQRGLQAWLDDYVAAFGGQAKVDRYFPQADRNNEPSFDDWQAEQENNDMQSGGAPLLTDEQNHEVHAVRHLQGGFTAIEAVKGGADPQTPFLFLQTAIPHIQEHLSKIPRENIRKKLEEGLRQLLEGFKVLEKLIQEQADQQQQASQLSFDQQMKTTELQAKLAERQAKLEQGLGQKEAKFEADRALADASTAADIQRKDAVAVAEMRRKRAGGGGGEQK